MIALPLLPLAGVLGPALVALGVVLVVAGIVVLLLRQATPERAPRPAAAPVASGAARAAAPRAEPARTYEGTPWPTTSAEMERIPLAPAADLAGEGTGVRVRLTVVERGGQVRGERAVTLRGRHVIGRIAPELALRFPDDPSMSAQHCELVAEDGSVLLRDLDSSNGTVVNGVPVLAGQRYRLEDGDVLQLGDTRIAVALPGGAADALRPHDGPISREAR